MSGFKTPRVHTWQRLGGRAIGELSGEAREVDLRWRRGLPTGYLPNHGSVRRLRSRPLVLTTLHYHTVEMMPTRGTLSANHRPGNW